VSVYRYLARRPDGNAVSGLLHGASRVAALATLAERRLLVTSLEEDRRPRRQLQAGELANPLAGLASLLGAGLPLDAAMKSAAQMATSEVREALADARMALAQGSSLSRALEATLRMPPTVCAAIRAGEVQGDLAGAIERVARDLQREDDLRREIRSALLYPMFLLTAGGASMALVGGIVLPRFSGLFADSSQSLPVTTRVLLSLGAMLSPRAIVLVAALTVALAVAIRSLQPRWTAAAWRRLPVVGSLRQRWAAVRICRTLGCLLRAGLPAPQALEVAASAAGDPVTADLLLDARREVLQGKRLSNALSRSAVLPERSMSLISYGDEAGRLPDFLDRAARQEDAELVRRLRSLVALIEPIFVVAFGTAVALMALGVLQALYGIRPAAF